MTQNPKKAAKLTTDQAMRRLFPKPVIEKVRREIAPDESDLAGGPGVSEKPPSKVSIE
jgi:hypothetical protein